MFYDWIYSLDIHVLRSRLLVQWEVITQSIRPALQQIVMVVLLFPFKEYAHTPKQSTHDSKNVQSPDWSVTYSNRSQIH